jgi:acyl carrier protein
MEDTARLERSFRDALGLDDAVDLTTMAYGTIEAWDSLAHMQLVAALETEFGIMLDADEVIAMSDFGVVRDILRDNHGRDV